ncbi:MAG TPA: sulfatase-like hydrolase/transferase, partial [Planctomycetota bacterium]|nr:sulfatase-like hydrolase/transferase [Planctomycetota bacterium]
AGAGAIDAAVRASTAAHRVDRPPLAASPVHVTPDVRESLDALRGLYLAGVRETDEGFGGLLDALAAHGLDESAYVLFASDHGEAFGEHGSIYHCQPGYEAVARVPLLLRGPGLEPGDRTAPVSLLDVAPTCYELAGIQPQADRSGRPLLSVEGERPLFVEETWVGDARDSWVALQGDVKFYSDGCFERPVSVDLGSDPTESNPRLPGEPDFDAAALEGLRRRYELLRVPLHPPETLAPTPATVARLRALGYAAALDGP